MSLACCLTHSSFPSFSYRIIWLLICVKSFAITTLCWYFSKKKKKYMKWTTPKKSKIVYNYNMHEPFLYLYWIKISLYNLNEILYVSLYGVYRKADRCSFINQWSESNQKWCILLKKESTVLIINFESVE